MTAVERFIEVGSVGGAAASQQEAPAGDLHCYHSKLCCKHPSVQDYLSYLGCRSVFICVSYVYMCVLTGHSMAETLTVALRVAEEAIEEAIAKAETFRDSLVS